MPRAARLSLAVLLLAGLLAVQLTFGARALMAVFHETRGVAAERADDFAAAREAFAQARAAAPYNAEYPRLEATAAMKLDDTAAAVPLLAESLALAPFAPLSLRAAAEAYLELDRAADAEAVIARAAQIQPQEWRLYYMRGVLDLQRGQSAPAVAELTAASRIVAPPSYEVLYQLARAQYVYGDVGGSALSAERALRLQPFAVEARTLYGKGLLSTERVAEARVQFEYVEREYLQRERAGEDVRLQIIEAQDLLSIVLLAEGAYNEAFRKFDEFYPRLSATQIDEFAYRLSDMTWRMREPFAPIALWRRSLDLLAQTKRLGEFDASIEAIRLMCTSAEFDTVAIERARAFTAGGNPEYAFEMLAAVPPALKSTVEYRLAHAEALAKWKRNDRAREELTALLGEPGLSPAIRKQAEVLLAEVNS